jgi:hypothetical protein
MKFVEDQYRLPHQMQYDRYVTSLSKMLNTTQTPRPPVVLKRQQCSAASMHDSYRPRASGIW